MKLVFATHNQHKFKEVNKLMPKPIDLVSLEDIGCFDEIPETGATLEENAKLKANYVINTFGLPCFADDTGLLVDALNGAPGVYSARYAGKESNADANIAKLLAELKGKTNRLAKFKTVIAYRQENETKIFEGFVEGKITIKRQGNEGFGYDPIFMPLGYQKTFAQLPIEVKNSMSHRGRAIQKLITFLQK